MRKLDFNAYRKENIKPISRKVKSKMKNYGIQHSTVKPASMEITETKVFLYKDITEIQTEDGVQYEFDLVEYDKDEYIKIISEKNAALEQQVTDTQLALCEVYELMV